MNTYSVWSFLTVSALLVGNGLPTHASTPHKLGHKSAHHENRPRTSLIIIVAKSLARLRSLSRDPITNEQLLKIADKCSAILSKSGVSEYSTTIIVAVNLCIPDGAVQPLSDVFAAYTTLRKRGMSSADAVKEVRGMETAIVSGGG